MNGAGWLLKNVTAGWDRGAQHPERCDVKAPEGAWEVLAVKHELDSPAATGDGSFRKKPAPSGFKVFCVF